MKTFLLTSRSGLDAANLKKLICIVGSCGLLALSSPAISQSENSADAEPPIETIVVTGSRIATASNRNASQPLSVMDEAAFEDSGALLIADALNELPQLGNSLENGTSINELNRGFGAGTQTVNLRNLGANRTLVLVNGRRHVGGDVGTSAVDLSMIPSGMIERVDIVTGAVSSIYGADAVTGVINLILKQDFEGTELALRGGGTSGGGGEEYAFSATHGGLFASGNYIAALEYTKQGSILGDDRDYAQLDGSASSGLAVPSAGSGVNPGGLFAAVGGLGGFDQSGTFTQPFAERFHRMPYRSLQNELERLVLSGRVGVDLSDSVSAFLEATLAEAEVVVDIEPQLAIFSNAGFAGSGTAGFRFPTGPTVMRPELGTNLRAITRRFVEFGPRSTAIERETFRFSTGFDVALDFADLHVSYQFGQVDATQKDFDTIDKLALVNAINPVTCAATPGCVFVDLYGRGTIDPNSESAVARDLMSESKGEQQVLSAYLTGDVFDFMGQPLEYAVGIEWRDENASVRPNSALIAVPDPIGTSGNPVGLQGTRTFFGNTSGNYDVLEAYGELRVPFSESFDLGLSMRASDYSTVGQETTWGANAQWRLIDNFTLRASIGRATRAPNAQELFAPDSARTSEILDPCDTQSDTGESRQQPAGCAEFVGPSFNPSNLDSNVRAVSGGNPNLDSETADTYTVGFVLQSAYNLALSVDYFNIEMKDVLAPAFGPQATVNNCITTGNAFFCDNVTRDPTTGFVTTVRSEQVNLASDSVAGLELAMQAMIAVGAGELRLDGIYTRLLTRDRKVNDASPTEDLVGRVDNIENKFNLGANYRLNRFDLGLVIRFLDEGVQSVSANPDVALGNDIDSITYVDLYARYQVSDALALRIGIENATDEDAPIVTSLFEGVGAGGAIAPGLYDVRGRYMFAGVEFSF